MCATLIGHGQAAVKQGFSVNRNIEDRGENLKGERIYQRENNKGTC